MTPFIGPVELPCALAHGRDTFRERVEQWRKLEGLDKRHPNSDPEGGEHRVE